MPFELGGKNEERRHFHVRGWRVLAAQVAFERTRTRANAQTPANIDHLCQTLDQPNPCERMQTTLQGTRDKAADTLSVTIPNEETATNRGILAKITRIYDPLGIVSRVAPSRLKVSLSRASRAEASLGRPLRRTLASKCEKWEQALPGHLATRRSLAQYQEPIAAVELQSVAKLMIHLTVFGEFSSVQIPGKTSPPPTPPPPCTMLTRHEMIIVPERIINIDWEGGG